jgi:hypothetical protein
MLSAQRLFEDCFPAAKLKVQSYGNVLAGIALLEGLATEEFRHNELSYHDPDYQLIIAVRAEKSR